MERGIYRNPATGGLEIEYADSHGRIRWKMVDGDLAAAREARLLAERARLSFATIAEEWLALQTHLRPRSREGYERALRRHLFPRIGQSQIGAIDEEAIAGVIRELKAEGLSGWTIHGILIPLGRVFTYAVRRKLMPYNPVRMLERSERPQIIPREKRILRADEIDALLRATPPAYLPIIATAVFTGLRLSELLGLLWADIDLENGILHVRRQLDRSGNFSEPKTVRSRRTVGVAPSLVQLLLEHKRTSAFTEPTDSVFATQTGMPMHYRNVTRRGLAVATAKAQLNKEHQPRLRFHDLRHTYTSLLIAQGINVIYVSRQLGHAYPGFTLNTYGGLFDQAENASRAAQGIEAVFPVGLTT